MSNVKQVTITGTIPFDCVEHPDMQRFLAQLNAPGSGLHIRYSEYTTTVLNSEIKRNMPPTFIAPPSNGRTTIYGFCIHGEEAVSWSWIDALKKAIVDCGGSVNNAKVIDLEA